MSWAFYEEWEIGEKTEFGSHHFSREEIIQFARAYDPQPFHLDDEAGRQSIFGRLSASGWHTTAGFMKCWAGYCLARRAEKQALGKALPEMAPSPGFEALQWRTPVFVGDTVSYSGEVVAKRPLASRPRWGLVTNRIEGVNQHGVLVMSLASKLLIERRASAQLA